MDLVKPINVSDLHRMRAAGEKIAWTGGFALV